MIGYLPLNLWNTNSVVVCTAIPTNTEVNRFRIPSMCDMMRILIESCKHFVQSCRINMKSVLAGHCSPRNKQANNANVSIQQAIKSLAPLKQSIQSAVLTIIMSIHSDDYHGS